MRRQRSLVDPTLPDASDRFRAAHVRVDELLVAPSHSTPSEMTEAGRLLSRLSATSTKDRSLHV